MDTTNSGGTFFKNHRNTKDPKRPLPSKSSIVKLAPFLDRELIFRVKGRLENSFLSYDERHPLILPKTSRLSELIVSQAHHDSLHGNQQLTLSKVLRRFWIISAKSLINRLNRGFRGITPVQLMNELPVERVTVSKPFTYIGLDYAGFVCLCSRAIHLELVSDLETQRFLASFKRFISRHGQCVKIFSDNTRNFIDADREINSLFSGAKKIFPEIAELLANQRTTWSFILPHSPHFGRIWESYWETRLTFEEMTTVLCQIEIASTPVLFI